MPFLIRALSVALSVLSSASALAASGPFHYDAATGACIDANGASGLNALLADELFLPDVGDDNAYSDRDAECADLCNVDFEPRVGIAYPLLQRWNLRGADLTGASMFFVNVVGARLEGAKLGGLGFGYTTITGSIDAHTTYNARFCALSVAAGATQIRCFR